MLAAGEKTALNRLSERSDNIDPTELVIITDAGRDHDDETALLVANGLQKLGLVDIKAVIANLKPADERAKLVRGALDELGLDDVAVGVGSDINPSYSSHEREFDVPYMAEDVNRIEPDGQALLRTTFEQAEDGSLTLLLISGMSDAAEFIRTYPELAKAKLDKVSIMGGVEIEDGALKLDESGHMIPDSSYNNNVDMDAAKELYAALQDLGIPMQFLVRPAAYEMAEYVTTDNMIETMSRAAQSDNQYVWEQAIDRIFDSMDRSMDNEVVFSATFFDKLKESGTHMGARLHRDQEAAILHLWERVNLDADDPAREGLPGRVNREWFLEKFTDNAQKTAELLDTIVTSL